VEGDKNSIWKALRTFDVTITAGGTNELTFPTAAKSDIPSYGQSLAFFTGQAMP
jgi:hypothetical protein